MGDGAFSRTGDQPPGAFADSQWQRMQDMAMRKLAARQGGAGVPGLSGGPSGAASPWDEVPGGGSVANALLLENPMVEDRARYDKLADDALVSALLGYGVAGSSMMAGPNPLSLVGAIGGGLYGLGSNAVSASAAEKARKLGFQGN